LNYININCYYILKINSINLKTIQVENNWTYCENHLWKPTCIKCVRTCILKTSIFFPENFETLPMSLQDGKKKLG